MFTKVVFQIVDNGEKSYLSLININIINYTVYEVDRNENDLMEKYIRGWVLKVGLFNNIEINIIYECGKNKLNEKIKYDFLIDENEENIIFNGEEVEGYKKKYEELRRELNIKSIEDYDETDMVNFIMSDEVERRTDKYVEEYHMDENGELKDMDIYYEKDEELREKYKKEIEDEWKIKYNDEFRVKKGKEIKDKMEILDKVYWRMIRGDRSFVNIILCKYFTQLIKLYIYDGDNIKNIYEKIVVKDVKNEKADRGNDMTRYELELEFGLYENNLKMFRSKYVRETNHFSKCKNTLDINMNYEVINENLAKELVEFIIKNGDEDIMFS